MADTTATENETEQLPIDPTGLLTAGDLAKRLRISIRQVRRLDKSGSLPRSLKIGALKRWDPDEITAWLKCGAPVRAEWEKRQATQTVGVENVNKTTVS